MSEPPRKETPELLLKEFETYDQHVDVVAIFEWVFTDPSVRDLPETVAHFERFPHIKTANGPTLTPDFTVLFTDGTAIISEIAKIALHPNSVDKLCSQLGKYANLVQIPCGSNGQTATAVHVDVMYLVDMSTGNTAYREITNRYRNPDHPYTPPSPPCIVQFARQADGYTFQRHQGSDNGTLSPGSRRVHIGNYLDSDFRPPTSRWINVKVARPFMNDPIKKLYLATHLTMRTWNDLYGPGTGDIIVTAEEVARHLRKHYGVGRVGDVKAALELLDRAGLAAPQGANTWTVSRLRLTRRNEKDVQRIIAERLDSRTRRAVPRAQIARPSPPMNTLFDL